MINWIPLNPISASEEIEGNTYLIFTRDRIVSATHDAVNRCFYYESDEVLSAYPYRLVKHYADVNFPNIKLSNEF